MHNKGGECHMFNVYMKEIYYQKEPSSPKASQKKKKLSKNNNLLKITR